MVIFDIETAPAPDTELLAILPEFEAPEHPGVFDPASVRTGNLKDAAKIAAKIEEARAFHAAQVQSYTRDVEAARAQHFADFKRQAALSPLTGRVLAIGVQIAPIDSVLVFDGHDDEWNLLRQFWMAYESAGVDDSPTRWGGWNIFNFDLPFLMRRSWKLGVQLPDGVRDRHDRYWGPRWVDLMHRFQAGNRQERYTKLDSASKFFGVGEKTGSGADFAGLWETDRKAAKEYLANDVLLTRAIADRIVGGGGFGLGDELIGARAGLVDDDDDI